MTFWEALEKNKETPLGQLYVPYMQQIVEEQGANLNLKWDGELIEAAAQEMYYEPGTDSATALDHARTGYADKDREAAAESFNKALDEEAELCGYGAISPDDMLSVILNAEAEEPSGKNVGDPVNAAAARKILTRQAESLRGEKCLYDIHYLENGELWRAILRFKNAPITGEGKLTLAKMKHNAHRTILSQKDDLKVVRFIVAG